MKTIFTLVFASSISLLGANGCKKHDAASPATMGSGSATGSATMTGSAATTGSAGSAAMTGSAAAMGSAAPDIPTAADFETQAATDITDKNLESQLDKVEKDLGK
jgi:hypothetical protein